MILTFIYIAVIVLLIVVGIVMYFQYSLFARRLKELETRFEELERGNESRDHQQAQTSREHDEMPRLLRDLRETLEGVHGTIATNQLKSLEMQENVMNNVQQLFQRNLEEMASISTNLALLADQGIAGRGVPDLGVSEDCSSSIKKETSPRISTSASTGISRDPLIQESSGWKSLDEFVNVYREQIHDASLKGPNAVRGFVRQASPDQLIELEWPSDRLFVLLYPGPGSRAVGKAFVQPGALLGRPWVEWFDLPKGVYDPIESTTEPATLVREEDREWRVVTKGKVRQE